MCCWFRKDKRAEEEVEMEVEFKFRETEREIAAKTRL